MFVKQIDVQEALRLAEKGIEVKVLIPAGNKENKWEEMMPDTLQNLLEGLLFFGSEPALERQLADQESAEPPLTAEEKKDKKKREGKTDVGKLMALYKAGWPQRKIAKELGITAATVAYYLEKERGKAAIEELKAAE